MIWMTTKKPDHPELREGEVFYTNTENAEKTVRKLKERYKNVTWRIGKPGYNELWEWNYWPVFGKPDSMEDWSHNRCNK